MADERAAPAQPIAPAAGSPSWESWAPPLDPPEARGLPWNEAAAIAAALWDEDPHECAAQMWDAYAATLPPSAPVSQVATGSQSVTYSPPMPGGEYGLAVARAAWHRSLTGTLRSAPLRLAPPAGIRSGAHLDLEGWV